MRCGVALLLLFVFGASSPAAQTISSMPSLRSPAPPTPGLRVTVLQPVGSSLLQSEAASVQRLPAVPRASSLARHVGWGALLGASAGVLSSVVVLSLCDAYCEGNRSAGVALHVSLGAVAGAGIGAMLHQLRR